MDFIRAEGKHFAFKGEEIRLRGFGVGTWLNLEHFMLGLPSSDRMIRATVEEMYGKDEKDKFFSRFQENFFGEKDLQLLKDCHVNFIRVPFNFRLFMDENTNEGFREEGFKLFDRLFRQCRESGIFAMIDLHTTPGAQNPDWHSDNSYGFPHFWEHQAFRDQMARLWSEIARRYKDEPAIMGYDLLNEPAMANWKALNDFYRDAIASIRRYDSNHVIVLEGDHFSMDFSGLEKFDDDQLALGFHYYPSVWVPDVLERSLDRQKRCEMIAEGLDRLVSIKDKYDCPAFCGEYGYGKDSGEEEFTIELIKDTMGLMEERKLDWLIWSYKDAHFMGLTYPKDTSRWMRLAGIIEKRWTQDIEKAQAQELLDIVKDKFFPEMTEEERYLEQFRFRACMYPLQAKYILKPALKEICGDSIADLAEDFSFENCEVYEPLKDLITETLSK